MTSAARPMRSFRVYALITLIYNVAVILWGAFVRASGSGAGCGEHWPLCNGVVVPVAPTLQTVIELSHRLTSGLALLLAAGMVVFAVRVFPKGHVARRAAWAVIFFELMEAVLGAALVLLGHVARNPSTARGYSLSAHFINTLLLVAALTVVVWSAARERVLVRPGARIWILAFALTGALLLTLGVSGVIAALGDTLFRTGSLSEGFRQDFANGAHPFVRLRVWHPVIAAIASTALAALCYAVIVRQVSAAAVRAAYTVAGLILFQLVVGIINLTLLAPVPLQIVHLLVADLVWIAFIVMGAETLLQSSSAGRPAHSALTAEMLAHTS